MTTCRESATPSQAVHPHVSVGVPGVAKDGKRGTHLRLRVTATYVPDRSKYWRTFAAIWRSVILSAVSTPTTRSPSPSRSRVFQFDLRLTRA